VKISKRAWAIYAVVGGAVYWLIYRSKAQAGMTWGAPGSAAVNPATGLPVGVAPVNPLSAAALTASTPGVSFAPSTLQPGVLQSTLTAVPAITATQAASARSFWSTLTPADPPATGFIVFPSGTQVAASLMTNGNFAQDGGGNNYVLWAGQTYMLGAQDSTGNYPAFTFP
jgi:hypothetical protein